MRAKADMLRTAAMLPAAPQSAGKQASRQAGKRASGQAGKRASGQAGKRASGQAGKRASADPIEIFFNIHRLFLYFLKVD
jgi:hypothetical protein